MAQWVSFKTIKEHVGMEQVLGHYNLLEHLTRKGTNLVGVCPIHHGTNPTQFHVSLAKNNFNCFGDCHGGGNVIDFVVVMEGMAKDSVQDQRKAALLFQEWFAVSPERLTETSNQVAGKIPTGKGKQQDQQPDIAPPEPVKNPPLKFTLKNLDAAHPYLMERGLTQETIATFGVGLFSGRGIMAGQIAIPIHNEQGELVAYAGRWPGEPPEGEGKYKLPPGFHKLLVVFNLHRAQVFAKDHGLILVEGFFGVMRLWQAGVYHTVALMGSVMSEEQEALIVNTVGPQGKVALMFDEDAAGRAGRDDVLARLSRKVYVKVIELGEEGMQPDRLGEEDIKRLLG